MRIHSFSIAVLIFISPTIFFFQPKEAKACECEEIKLGVFVPNNPGDFTELDKIELSIGRQTDIIPWYQAWGSSYNRNFRSDAVSWVHKRGDLPMITWEPWDPDLGVHQNDYSMSSIADGRHDEYIRSWAREAAKFEQEILLRFAHEMNGSWYPWTPIVEGKSPEVYKAAWRRIVNIFRNERAHNVKFVWSPNRDYYGATPLLSLYPGDKYVDWIGIDGYNFGEVEGQKFRSFDEMFADTYLQTREFSQRPVMIGEMGSSDIGGSRSQWILDNLNAERIKSKFPDLMAIIYFNHAGSGDWVLRVDDGSLQSFSVAVSEWGCE